MTIYKLTSKTLEASKVHSWFPILIALAVIIFFPSQAYADISFPTIQGISPTDDPVTIAVKLVSFIVQGIILFLFAAAFLAAAYVAISTILKMIKDRENAGDLVGHLAAAIFVIVLVWWFADQGEQAAIDLGNVQLSYIESISARAMA